MFCVDDGPTVQPTWKYGNYYYFTTHNCTGVETQGEYTPYNNDTKGAVTFSNQKPGRLSVEENSE